MPNVFWTLRTPHIDGSSQIAYTRKNSRNSQAVLETLMLSVVDGASLAPS